MKISKKRLLIAASGVTGLGAVAMLVTGVTFGLFSATPSTSSTSTFATGTVSIGSPANTVCLVTNMVPGDDSMGYNPQLAGNTDPPFLSCEFQVTYTGSAPAYIGLTAATSGNLPLLWQIGQSATDTTNADQFASGGVINSNSAADPMYVATDSGADHTYTFWVDYALPSSYTSQVNTGASISLTVYAVQQGNNGIGACTVGQQCNQITAWS
jgi:hypothetical protein